MKNFLAVLTIFLLIVEYYSYQGIKVLFKNKKIQYVCTIISFILFLVIAISFYQINRNNKFQIQFLIGLFIIIYIPKLLFAFILFLEDIFRILKFLVNQFYLNVKNFKEQSSIKYLPQRRKAVSLIGLGIASIPFLGVIEGIIWGKFDYRIRRKIIYFDDLPEEFDGYKVAQLSDIHMGSFNIEDYKKIERGIQMLNEENPDIFFFTGDSVNNYAEELKPWLPLLKKIKAKDGKISILGNHDYGIYAYGVDNVKKQQENINKIQEFHEEINWQLLKNESLQIKKGKSYINIIGVKNWGEGNFPKDGDLEMASKNIKDGDFNILLSHDPSHFDAHVKKFSKKIHLTLSGHTHGMQFGVEIPGIAKWSPVKYRYPKWADLYKEKDRYLYVNRGFGYLGFSGRVGIWPEITIIELKKTV
ncbi:metallophosphoesterase [Apibacter muscae]|uniref:Metallophosphoesterase n=1 Tax=Apibacter muscae TaxID=2509004 RepID=A0A563DJ39_9FLAO|nr:metallophosphoesterase [Apibacter muscae]TWP29824.1 metallophosphoesterase [Apibacter muscae]TWP30972.1 metallophosphoesterase [Apibacter muscae]